MLNRKIRLYVTAALPLLFVLIANCYSATTGPAIKGKDQEKITQPIPVEQKTGTDVKKTDEAATTLQSQTIQQENPNSPTGVIKRYEKDVKEVVTKYKGKTDKTGVSDKNNEILARVRQFFDIGELARLSLGSTWEKVTPKEQAEYKDVFSKLVERSYVSKSDKLVGDYDVKYLGEEIKGDNAIVKSAVAKEDADVDIQYFMHNRQGTWMIYNIIADTTNLVKNYNSQFNSIVVKEGFPGLMRRMKSKLSEQDD
jgi:phospholipid transport system substrate-binding protein